jgi:hypothetical protein
LWWFLDTIGRILYGVEFGATAKLPRDQSPHNQCDDLSTIANEIDRAPADQHCRDRAAKCNGAAGAMWTSTIGSGWRSLCQPLPMMARTAAAAATQPRRAAPALTATSQPAAAITRRRGRPHRAARRPPPRTAGQRRCLIGRRPREVESGLERTSETGEDWWAERRIHAGATRSPRRDVRQGALRT